MSFTIKAQEINPAATKLKTYKVRVTHIDGTVARGWFRGITDDSLFISNALSDTRRWSIHFSEIQKVKFRNKNAITTGLTLGSIGGFATGFIIGHATKKSARNSNDSFGIGEAISNSISPGLSGILFAPIGAGVGALIGAVSSRSLTVNGDYEKFQFIKKWLQR